MPSSLQLNGELFSTYKNHTTLKGLVGISPGGAVTFTSELYKGSISDREIVKRSGFLNLPFDDQDCIMANKGFTIQDLLPLRVNLNLPPFLGASSTQMGVDVEKHRKSQAFGYMLNVPSTRLRIYTCGKELFHYIEWEL